MSEQSNQSSVIDIVDNRRSNSTSKYKEFGSKLSLRTKLFYSCGHIYNDLCASIWFSYTLLYFKLSFDDTTAGLLLLLGQVADAISTPLIGYVSDKNINTMFFRYGRRKIWHLIGSVFVTCSFPLIFNSCIPCAQTHQLEKFIYYSIFIGLFQFGWAAVQVAHLSLITDLTDSSAERVELNSYRQAASVASSICVYAITLLLLGVDDSTISQSDSAVFMKVVHFITVIGIFFTTLFHVYVKEPHVQEMVELKEVPSVVVFEPKVTENNESNSVFSSNLKLNLNNLNDKPKPNLLLEQNLEQITKQNLPNIESNQTAKCSKPNNDLLIWSDWLKSIKFWKICLIYMMSRLYVNVTQVYTPLYLQETLQLAKRNIAIVPFITYFTGFIFSFIGKSKYISSKNIICLGCFFSFVSCIWILWSNLTITIYEVFGVAAVFGIGGTFMLIGSLSLTADLINMNKISGAFVYGMMSFFDKLVNGVVIALVQHLKPETFSQLEPEISLVNNNNTGSSFQGGLFPLPTIVESANITAVTNSIATIHPIFSTDPTVFYLDVLVYISGAAVLVTFISLTLLMKKQIRSMFFLLCPSNISNK